MSVENQRYAYSYLVDNGFASNAAAGIVGNLIQESGVDPNSNQSGGPGMGIMQWTQGERWQSLLAFANQTNRNPYSLDLQLDFMLREMKAYGVYDRMQKMNNLEAATRLFMNVMESPDPQYANLNGRIEFAQTIRNKDPNAPTSADGGDSARSGDNGGGNSGGGSDPVKGEYGFSEDFLAAHPEIKKLVDQADNQNWTLERFQAAMKETDWYRKLSDAQQRWSVLAKEQPGQAKREIADQARLIETMASNMGVDLRTSEVNDLAKRAARNQLDSVTLTALISHKYDLGKPNETQSGQASVTIDQVKQIASDFGVKVDPHTMERWTAQVIGGQQTVEGLVDRIREQAKSLFPQVSKMLETQSTRDILDPYLNIAADELGVPTAQMKTNDNKWLRALQGDGGPLNADQWTEMVRTDRRYKYDSTDKAASEAAQLTTQLAAMFGAKG